MFTLLKKKIKNSLYKSYFYKIKQTNSIVHLIDNDTENSIDDTNSFLTFKIYKLITFCGIKLKYRNRKLENKLAEQQFINHVLGITKNMNQLTTIANFCHGENYTIISALYRLASQETAKYVIENMPTSIVTNNALDLLTYALSQVAIKGMFLEFGVFSGTTINHISAVKSDEKIYGFDSFEGLPEAWRSGFYKGIFATKKLPEVRSNVELIKGWFNETLPEFIKVHKEQCAFIHIDCDLYSSTKCIFDILRNQIVDGTVIVFDEYFNYPNWQEGEYKAFQEFINMSNLSYEYLGYNQENQQCAVKIVKKST